MHRLLTLLSLLTVLALGVAACGGGDEGSSSKSKDPAALYKDAITGLDELESGKLDAKLNTVLQLGGRQTIDLREQGAFAEAGGTKLPKFSIKIAVDQSTGQSQATEVVNTGEDFFVKQNGADKFESQGATAVDKLGETYKTEQEKLGTGRIPLLSLTPSDWAKNPKDGGEETVGGEKLQKVTADLDVPAFLKDLETGKNSQIGMGVTLTQGARELMEPGAKTKRAELTALVAEDGTLRRLSAGVDGDVAGGVTVDFDVDLTEVGKAQDITEPTQ